jgi:hypothetical protein
MARYSDGGERRPPLRIRASARRRCENRASLPNGSSQREARRELVDHGLEALDEEARVASRVAGEPAGRRADWMHGARVRDATPRRRSNPPKSPERAFPNPEQDVPA